MRAAAPGGIVLGIVVAIVGPVDVFFFELLEDVVRLGFAVDDEFVCVEDEAVSVNVGDEVCFYQIDSEM